MPLMPHESRSFVSDGAEWEVHEERDPPHLGGKPVLICYTRSLGRRIRQFPRNWRELPDSDLARVCNGH
jgi:hypothetical protein